MRTIDDILTLRLRRQLIEPPGGGGADPAAVVARLGAIQAQDYAGSLWAVAARCAPAATAADVERAIAERLIVRTWPMRGTLHLVAPADVRWMLGLLAARPLGRAASRHAELGVTDDVTARARTLFAGALSGGRQLARPDAMALLESAGISTEGQRGYHILWCLAQTGLLCCGPMLGRQQSFVLLDEWLPPGPAEQDSPPRELALARLAERYFASRGPATVADFAWWAGITKTDARAGLEAIADSLDRWGVDGREYWLAAADGPAAEPQARSVRLLPGFDEYMLGYTDRTLQLGEHREPYGATVSANGMFSATLVIGGRIAGVWKRAVKRETVTVTVRAFRPLDTDERDRIAQEAQRYAAFLGLSANQVTYSPS